MPIECIIELICSLVQKSLKNKVKPIFNSCIIEFFFSAEPLSAKKRSIPCIKEPSRAHMITCARITYQPGQINV